MLIIKAKNNLSREDMKKQYKNFLEQMQVGLIFINDEYDITVVEPFHDWIPVDEGLPEDSDKVLTVDGLSEKVLVTDDIDMFVAWRKDGKWISNDIYHLENTYPITKWMPLPKLYVKPAVLGCAGQNEDKKYSDGELIPIDNIKQEIFNAIDNVPITLSRDNADKLLKADIQNIIDKRLKKGNEEKTEKKSCNTCKHYTPDNPYCECCFDLDKYERK